MPFENDRRAVGEMPMSDAAMRGATGGSLGGASKSDLRRGFTDCCSEDDNGPDSVLDSIWPPEEPGGFLGRPHGWER